MKAPHCKLCGSDHWPRDPHKWAEQAPAEKPAAVSRAPEKFDRNKYQREYMRKRRAQRKALIEQKKGA